MLVLYYNILIELKKGKNKNAIIETDLDIEKIENKIKSYLNGNDFSVNGYVSNKNNISRLVVKK